MALEFSVSGAVAAILLLSLIRLIAATRSRSGLL